MPYSSVSEVPANVKSKLKGKKRRQWMHVFNSSLKRHGDESRAFAEAWATAQKAADWEPKNTISKQEADYQDEPRNEDRCGVCSMFQAPNSCTLVEGAIAPSGWCRFFDRKASEMMKSAASDTFNLFLPLAKVDKEKRLVYGYASTPSLDMDGEIVSLDAIKKALPGYWEWRNIRAMHQPIAIGVAKEANVDDVGLFLTAKIVDDDAWNKVEEGVYKGFSIGGRKLAKKGNTITDIEMVEVSIVDRPANPDCKFDVAKRAKQGKDSAYLIKVDKPDPKHKVLAKLAKAVEAVAKSGPPAGRDGFSLPAKPSPKDLNPHHMDKNDGKSPDSDDEEDEEDVKKREVKTKERETLAGEGKALPDGSFPIANESDLRNAIRAFGRAKDKAKAQKHIISRARAMGRSDLIPENWRNNKDEERAKKARKLAKRLKVAMEKAARFDLGVSAANASATPSFLTLEADETSSGGSLESRGGAGEDRRQSSESHLRLRKGGPSKSEFPRKTEPGFLDLEAGPRFNLEDIDMTGEVTELDKVLAKAWPPKTKKITKAARVALCKSNLKKARKSMKECSAEIRAAHAMHKAAYLAKAAAAKKADKPKKDDDDDDDFDHAGAMEKLQKAYGQLNTMKTFVKAARNQLAKMGQTSESPTSGNSVYRVPAGVETKSQDELVHAGPGAGQSSGDPPLLTYEEYPGKMAKRGFISKAEAEAIARAAAAEAKVEVLEKLPAQPIHGKKPVMFDVGKAIGGTRSSNDDLNKVIFDGVDAAAIGSGDEMRHTEASAKAIGNMIVSGRFGKSVFDPSFHGTAGLKKEA